MNSAPERDSRQRNYRTYDFTRPDKLSNEQKRVLRNQFEPVCRLLCIHFGTTLRTVVEMWLLDVDEVRYRDVFNEPDASSKSLVAVFSPGPEQPQGMVQAHLGLMFGFLERMMGGTAVTPIKDKDLSEFEKLLFSQILTRVLGYYAKTFQIPDLTPTVERIDTECALVPKSYPPEESMVRQIFRISLNGYMGHVIIILPFEFFRPKLPDMRTMGTWRHPGPPDPNRLEELGVVDVSLTVELGRANLNLKQLMKLAPGDVVELGGPVTILAGDTPKFTARPGLMGDQVGVEILRPIVFEQHDSILVD